MNAPVSPAKVAIARSPVEVALRDLDGEVEDLEIAADIAVELLTLLFRDLSACQDMKIPYDMGSPRLRNLQYAVHHARVLARELSQHFEAAIAAPSKVQA